MEIEIGSPMLYAAFSAAVVVLLVADFVLLRAQGNHKVPVREAAAWSAAWFALAMAFAGWIWWHVGESHGDAVAKAKAVEYVTGYLIEKALAMENVFVWVTIFTFFATPAELQKRVLLYGVVGAILMRAALIYLGVVLIQRRNPVFRAKPLLIGKANTFAQLSLAACTLAHAGGVLDLGVLVAVLIAAVSLTTVLSAAGYAAQGLRALGAERAS